MAAFINLEDSPMFRKQINSLEQMTDELKDRCQKLYKGSKRYVSSLNEACNGDTTFADSLEFFGGGKDDPLSLCLGGPIISQFITAFRELATYKELLRSQVEHVLIDRLMQFISTDIQAAKDSRQGFDKSVHAYEQAREKFVSLKKGTREDVLVGLEEDLLNSKSAFERSRFNMVNALTNVEAKKKYEFLESFSAIMDAHLRYFKLGHDLLKQMEPLIHQVLTCAQQYKEMANVDQDDLGRRIQKFRTKAEMDIPRVPSRTLSTPALNDMDSVGGDSYKDIQAVMQSSLNGEVRIIKQGYLHKRSSSSRGDWRRRFFVLNSHGTLYYYRNKGPKPAIIKSHQSATGTDQNSGVFSRFRAKYNQTDSRSEESLSCCSVDLHTSTIKMEAEEKDLRLCFRIISPLKSYTLQAENEADRLDWVNKITGVITSLLNSRFLGQEPGFLANDKGDRSFSTETCSQVLSGHRRAKSSNDVAHQIIDVSKILRAVPGNDHCADCSSPEPSWASLNLGILLCIQCSGAHRNLGVHISKVRSITLDVKVWEPTVLDLFRVLGNDYCNSVWEELLSSENESRSDESDTEPVARPSALDPFHKKEKYVYLKYVEKRLISKTVAAQGYSSPSKAIWDAVKASDIRGLYRIITTSDSTILNTTYDEVRVASPDSDQSRESDCKTLDPSTCRYLTDSPHEPQKCLRGCSILHLACHIGDRLVIELLLLFGSDVNMRDFHGRTPLHHCIAKKNNELAKYLLRRGAHRLIKDWGGLTALERAMEFGAITDEELFILLAENQ